MKKYDSIVVGGGISGLLSALVLSKSGKKFLFLRETKILAIIVTAMLLMVIR